MYTTYTSGTYSGSTIRGLSGINIILGIWLIISPFILGFSGLPWPLWNNIVCGVIIGLLAASRLWSPQAGPSVSWVNALIGIWLIVGSFIWAYGPPAAAPTAGATAAYMPLGYPGALNAHWNDIVVGAIVLILAAWNAMSGRLAPPPATAH